MSLLLAVDPGPTESGWVILGNDNEIISKGKWPNRQLLEEIYGWKAEHIAIEMIASYGMPVGRDVFQTCVWIGRYIEASDDPGAVTLVTRNEVKTHVCHNSRANDANIRQALIDLFGAPGRKSAPGPTFGITGDMWAALGVAATVRGVTQTTEAQ